MTSVKAYVDKGYIAYLPKDSEPTFYDYNGDLIKIETTKPLESVCLNCRGGDVIAVIEANGCTFGISSKNSMNVTIIGNNNRIILTSDGDSIANRIVSIKGDNNTIPLSVTGFDISIKGNKNSISGAITNTTLTCEGDEYKFFCFDARDSTINIKGGKNELKVSSWTSLKLNIESLEQSTCEVEGYADIECRGSVFFTFVSQQQDPICFNSAQIAQRSLCKKITTPLDPEKDLK